MRSSLSLIFQSEPAIYWDWVYTYENKTKQNFFPQGKKGQIPRIRNHNKFNFTAEASGLRKAQNPIPSPLTHYIFQTKKRNTIFDIQLFVYFSEREFYQMKGFP